MLTKNAISSLNRSQTPLDASGTFTADWEDVSVYSSLVISAKTDADGTLYGEFSADGVTVHSTLTYSVTANVNEVHRVAVTRRYFRVRYVNGSVAQTALAIQVLLGEQGILTSALNQSVQNDSDAILVRSIDSEALIAQGLITGWSIVNKFGLNLDVDTATVPEDIWGAGGVYTGFATAAEPLRVASSSASDAAAGTGARTVRITGLDADYNVISETVTLNGTSNVVTSQSFLRAHTATALSAGSGGVNAGTITIGQNVTTANVMLTMEIGRNQTNSSAYTVPAGYTAYLRQLSVSCGHGTSAAIEGNIWTRAFGQPFRSRRPFFAANSAPVADNIYGGLVFTEKSDIVLRITYTNANNTQVNGGYDLVLVKNP